MKKIRRKSISALAVFAGAVTIAILIVIVTWGQMNSPSLREPECLPNEAALFSKSGYVCVPARKP